MIRLCEGVITQKKNNDDDVYICGASTSSDLLGEERSDHHSALSMTRVLHPDWGQEMISYVEFLDNQEILIKIRKIWSGNYQLSEKLRQSGHPDQDKETMVRKWSVMWKVWTIRKSWSRSGNNGQAIIILIPFRDPFPLAIYTNKKVHYM